MQRALQFYLAHPELCILALTALEWAILCGIAHFIKRRRKMSEEDLEKVRRAGEVMGRLQATVEALAFRQARMEKAILAIVGAIVAAWAKSKGLF